MAKAKLEIYWDEDVDGVSCLVVQKKRGKLNEREVYEALEHKYPGQKFMHLVEIMEEPPMDLYEEGDIWLLYEPEEAVKILLPGTNLKITEDSDYCRHCGKPLNF